MGENCWCAGTNNNKQYLQWDFGDAKWVGAVQTRGRPNHAQWVTRYKLSYSIDGLNWVGLPLEFEGNSDQDTVKTNIVPGFAARMVRLHPVAWHKHISMRAELLGCAKDPWENVAVKAVSPDAGPADKTQPGPQEEAPTDGGAQA